MPSNNKTLRVIFRCPNVIQMALLDGHLRGYEGKNEFISVLESTQETRMIEIDITRQKQMLDEWKAKAPLAEDHAFDYLAKEAERFVLGIELEYDKAEIISLDRPVL